uniref:hypothetical protein n=1 Tax=Pelagibacter ubique TaxID=198252 RepID=UPI001177E0C1
MNNLFLILLILLIAGCSFNQNSKFWTSSQNILQEENLIYKEIFVKEEALKKELNTSLTIDIGNSINNNIKIRNYY